MKAILQSLGSVHSRCSVSSLAWLVYALVQVLHQDRDVMPGDIMGVTSAILGMLTLSCMAVFPIVRHHHNVFERTHRFAGANSSNVTSLVGIGQGMT
ncbi:hypothetical protein PR202_gb05553 [Eleusine coracana subsp. coracana]|uniref:Uncharacterized protein n=1 Tax=Eleusine coracana subsp. coracana TaxID=191504 RepID=A0AAV5E7A1_ELECO|nr:hypothetical protein PR202_gb05553 [Eleusine coracana subsp. coracana]